MTKYISNRLYVHLRVKYFFIRFCNFRKRDGRESRLEKRGIKQIEKELDIISFIRRQRITDFALELLFSKSERYFMRHHKRNVINSS